MQCQNHTPPADGPGPALSPQALTPTMEAAKENIAVLRVNGLPSPVPDR